MASLAQLVYSLLNLYSLGLLVYVLLPLVQHQGAQRCRRWLARFYDPFLRPIQRAVSPIRLGRARVDISPGILFIAVALLRRLIVGLLLGAF